MDKLSPAHNVHVLHLHRKVHKGRIPVAYETDTVLCTASAGTPYDIPDQRNTLRSACCRSAFGSSSDTDGNARIQSHEGSGMVLMAEV